MPQTITIDYGKNIAPTEIEQLRLLEPALQKAFGIAPRKYDHTQWSAKVDSHGRTVFLLEGVPGTGSLVTYCTLDELPQLNAKELARHIGGDRNSYAETVTQRPMMFEHLSSAQRAEIVAFRIDITLTVPRVVTKLGSLSSYSPSPQMPTHVEVPPLPAPAAGGEVAAPGVSLGLEEVWQDFFLTVYRAGGRVYFREFDNDKIEVVVRYLMTSIQPA